MRLYFRPFLGLTISVVIAFFILVSLGTWQYQRLQWKTALLEEIDAVADEPPFTSVSEIKNALAADEPIDFRRVSVVGKVHSVDPFFVFSSRSRNISWRVFLPVSSDGYVVFAALQTISDLDRASYLRSPDATEDVLNGYVRLARPRSRGETKSSPDKNRWFGFNPMPDTHDWGDMVDGGADMRFYIDTVPGNLNANELPARRPEIRNNHFDYMLTWYGLAIVLLIIYLILHKRAGRLGLL